MENLLQTTDFFEKDLSPEELAGYLQSLGFVDIAGETLEFDDHDWVVTSKKENGIGFNNGYTAVNTKEGNIWVIKGRLNQEQFNKIVNSFGVLPSRGSTWYGNTDVPLGLGGHLKNKEIQVKEI